MPTRDPFKISDHVSDFNDISRRYAELSAQTLSRHSHHLDLAYGANAAERLDVILPQTRVQDAPVHMFVHGGYWRAGSKSDYSYMAEPIVAAGGIAVVIDYALMPQARMPELVSQVRRAAYWVDHNISEFGGNAARLSVSGHSAGAHLASYLAATAPGEAPQACRARKLVLISGIYDLAPIPNSFLQPELGLTWKEVEDWSPLDADHHADAGRSIIVGGEETAPFHSQARELQEILSDSDCNLRTLAALNHMSIILEMGNPATAAGQILSDIVANS
jgi:arylformamidase